MKCHACSKEVTIPEKVGRRDECPFCNSDLHCCLNCFFYDPLKPKQCKEPVAELVKEKKKANFCDYFRIAASGNASSGEAILQSRKALENLFKR